MPNASATIDQASRNFRLRLIFIIGAVILLLSMAVAFITGYAAIRADDVVGYEEQLIDQLRETFSTLKDAETGQRGFLLTGEDPYLEPYNLAKARINGELTRLDSLVAHNSISLKGVAELKPLIAAKLDELDGTISIRRKQGLPDALSIVRNNTGKILMDKIRSQVAHMISVESDQRSNNQNWANLLGNIRTYVFILVTIANLLFLLWAYRRIRFEISLRDLAMGNLREQKELLRVTLSSIGDGVIITDENANITFLNPIAELLTGWNSPESEGLPVTKIFNIINESTRNLVESPVEKVLRLGIVVGLANHTLLIRKDGSEIPIDDSGAPIRDSHGAIRGTVLIFRDFSEYKKTEHALRLAKEEAEAANIAKDNFLATLSHELRTPLTPVSAILSSWELGGKLPPQFLPEVQMMRRNVDLEARLIDDLLDLTRIVRGKLSLNPEVADVHALITSVTTMYQSEAHAKRLRLLMDLSAPQHFVYADPARLQQVFLNLLKNAIKFTPEGGSIDLHTANATSTTLSILIHDTGIGMAPETINKLFQPFEQGSDETVKRYGGLGLGLAISKALMDAQGGSISAQSSGVGKGATFSVSLPIVHAPLDAPSPPATPPLSPTRSLSILFVEDHPDTARVMKNLLGSFGHKVTLAQSVASATESFQGDNFDLLLSDIGLPDGTGIDLIKIIRKTSTIPAVALTGYGMEDDIADCLNAGFTSHLTKPINFQKLEMLIQQLAR